MQIKKRLITEKAVKLTVMVRMKLTVRTTTCMTWSNFKDLQHNASWCEIQWNVKNSRPPHTTCTSYLTFVETPAFFAIIDGALSAAIPTARDQYIPILFSPSTRELKISLAVIVSIIGTNPRNSVTDKVSSTPRINMACCATSDMSVLSSSATENITNDLTFFFSWLSKFAEMFEILPPTMFLVRLISAKTSASQKTRFLQPLGCILLVFTNSPSQHGFDANAISLAIR